MIDYKILCFGNSGYSIGSALHASGIPIEKIFRFFDDQTLPAKSLFGNDYFLNSSKPILPVTRSDDYGRGLFYHSLGHFLEVINENCFYFLVGGLGGIVFSNIVIELSKVLLTHSKAFVIIGTLPFRFEGRRRELQAISTKNTLRNLTNNVIYINNNDFFANHKDLTLSAVFSKIDYIIAELFKELIIYPQYAIYNNKSLNGIVKDDAKFVILKIKEFFKNNNLLSIGSSRIIIPENNRELIKILKIHSDLIFQISSSKFEELIGYIYKICGYEVELTGKSHDKGADLLVWTPPPVLGNKFLTIIQAKQFSPSNKVGSPIVQQLEGTTRYFDADRGQIITTSGFSKPAYEMAKKLTKIDLIQFDELLDRIKETIK